MSTWRKSLLSDANRERWGGRRAAGERRGFALDLRRRVVATLDRLASMHFQTGKCCDYRGALGSDAEWDLVGGVREMATRDAS